MNKISSLPQQTPSVVDLAKISERELLNLRICDLPLNLEGTWLQECIQDLYQELEQRQLIFKPICYLADEWLTPEGEPVVGIPFYLAHPTLTRLEKKMMLEAEGETKEWCMKLLRHETGHAICYAYELHKEKKWQEIFGSPDQEYPETYRFKLYSKNYVRHLEGSYAQYHPEEDFVETFAVWLTPHLDWQKQYQGWKAIQKLNYVDHVMHMIKGKPPLVKKGRKFWHYRTLKVTLENFYKKKKYYLAEDFPDFHDDNLKKIFAQKEQPEEGLLATVFIKKYKKKIIHTVSNWTGEKKYIIHDVLKAIYQRCRALKLICFETESVTLLNILTYTTTLIMNYIYTGWYRGERKRRKK